MEFQNQTQKSGDNSVNVQVDTLNVQTGLTYKDVRNIALDIFRDNFQKLTGVAAEIAKQRAEEITDKFLKQLHEKYPEGISMAQDPDMLHSMFTVQKEYARTGDKQSGDLLVDLLVERTKEKDRSLMQILLNESITVVPKLTTEQLSMVTLNFLLQYTSSGHIVNLQGLDYYINNVIAPLTTDITEKSACYQHLEYTGCGSIGLGSNNILELFLNKYSAMFVKGFPTSDLNLFTSIQPNIQTMLMISLRNPQMLQLSVQNENILRDELKQRFSSSEEEINNIINLYKRYYFTLDEVKDDLINRNACMKNLIDVWNNSSMKNMSLTSVGFVIASAYSKSKTGEIIDMSSWS